MATALHCVARVWQQLNVWRVILFLVLVLLLLSDLSAIIVVASVTVDDEPPQMVQVVMTQSQGILFCRSCANPLEQGSFVHGFPTYYSPTDFVVQGELIYAVPNDGSHEFFNAHLCRNRIVLLDRGKVPIVTKIRHAQHAGAIGAIIVNFNKCDPATDDLDQLDPLSRQICQQNPRALESNTHVVLQQEQYILWKDIEIASILISFEDGQRLRDQMQLQSFEVMGQTQFVSPALEKD